VWRRRSGAGQARRLGWAEPGEKQGAKGCRHQDDEADLAKLTPIAEGWQAEGGPATIDHDRRRPGKLSPAGDLRDRAGRGRGRGSRMGGSY
jgi:hypothetical protein